MIDKLFGYLLKLLSGIFLTLVFSFWAVFLLVLGYHVVRWIKIGIDLL